MVLEGGRELLRLPGVCRVEVLGPEGGVQRRVLRRHEREGAGAGAEELRAARRRRRRPRRRSRRRQRPPPANVSGCLGDYPSYGVDRHALWFGVNHYTFATGRLQGAALYGVRKADLLDARGPAYPRVAVFTSWGDAADAADVSPGALRLGFTLQPATPSAGEPFDDRRGGTQYVLASSYFFRTGLPSVVAWAITNTSLLGRGLPGGEAPALSPAVVLPALPLRKPAKVFSGGLRQEAAVVAAAAAAAAAAAGSAAARARRRRRRRPRRTATAAARAAPAAAASTSACRGWTRRTRGCSR